LLPLVDNSKPAHLCHHNPCRYPDESREPALPISGCRFASGMTSVLSNRGISIDQSFYQFICSLFLKKTPLENLGDKGFGAELFGI